MKSKRISEIGEYVLSKKTVSYDELCEHFGVSKNTMRRDIEELVGRGLLEKAYGGVVAAQASKVLPQSYRETRAFGEKCMIGQLAAGYVKAGDIIFVDAGTTAVKMIPHLAGKGRITVVTAGLGAIVEAVKLPEVTLISFGGAYDAHTNSFSGVNAVENLRKINISKAFLSATAVSIEHGLSSNSYLEAEIKGLMFEKVCRRFLLADSSKLDTTATISFAGLTDIDVFVTDRRPPERYVKFFELNRIALCAGDME